MLGFPVSTEFNKRIPKQKFYENLSVTPSMRHVFANGIRSVYWRNKLSSSTLNIAAGDTVTEVEAFEVCLNEPNLDESVLRQMDKKIPYHILFVLTCDGKAQAWIGYKEASASGGNAFKVDRYYHSDWISESELKLRIDGLDMDSIYENFVRQVAGSALQRSLGNNLKASIERDERRRLLERQIDMLEGKMRKEKQLNRQMEMNAKLKKLRKDMENIGTNDIMDSTFPLQNGGSTNGTHEI